MEIALLTDFTTLPNDNCPMTIAGAVKTSEIIRLGKRKLLRTRTSWRPAHA